MWLRMQILGLLVVTNLAFGAEPVGVGFEPGTDQEVLKVLVSQHTAPVILVRQFLEPRKARIDPARAASDTLLLRDLRNGRTAQLLSYRADAPLWVGPPLVASDSITLPVRTSDDVAALYRLDPNKMTVQRLSLPWQRGTKDDKAPRYERLFALTDAIIGVRSEGGVRVADVWRNDRATPVTLDIVIPNGDGRVTSIEDVAEANGRVWLLMTAVSGQNDTLGEVWLASFDRSLARGKLHMARLQTGRMASGHATFVRSGSKVSGIRVSVRETRVAQPTIHLYAFDAPSRPIWSLKMQRIEGDDDMAIIGVCQHSYMVAQKIDSGRQGAAEVEFSVIGPAGQRAVVDRIKLTEPGTVRKTLAAIDRERLWSVINVTRSEDTRRADGWYSWRAYRVDAQPVQPYCRFE